MHPSKSEMLGEKYYSIEHFGVERKILITPIEPDIISNLKKMERKRKGLTICFTGKAKHKTDLL